MLMGLAYRLLGTTAEAEDVVQETYLSWSAASHADIDNPDAWLTTVCTRKALDQLKSARKKNAKITLVCGFPSRYIQPRWTRLKTMWSFRKASPLRFS